MGKKMTADIEEKHKHSCELEKEQLISSTKANELSTFYLSFQ